LSSISIGYSFRERFLFWLEMRETLSAVHPAPPANQRDDGGHVAALDMTGHHVAARCLPPRASRPSASRIVLRLQS
jgi:hypothetical protein